MELGVSLADLDILQTKADEIQKAQALEAQAIKTAMATKQAVAEAKQAAADAEGAEEEAKKIAPQAREGCIDLFAADATHPDSAARCLHFREAVYPHAKLQRQLQGWRWSRRKLS